jgi:hypothetical protein
MDGWTQDISAVVFGEEGWCLRAIQPRTRFSHCIRAHHFQHHEEKLVDLTTNPICLHLLRNHLLVPSTDLLLLYHANCAPIYIPPKVLWSAPNEIIPSPFWRASTPIHIFRPLGGRLGLPSLKDPSHPGNPDLPQRKIKGALKIPTKQAQVNLTFQCIGRKVL